MMEQTAQTIKTKGIIFAGYSRTRLYPTTMGVSKQLLPIFDKPIIYYPISVLMLAGINDILIITPPEDLPAYKRLLCDGSRFGVHFTYAEQSNPDGLAQAFIIGADFIGTENVCLVREDNLFYGQGFSPKLRQAAARTHGATICGYQVKDPCRFGVVEFDRDNRVLSIEEKPQNHRSSFAITGLYFYDNDIVDLAHQVKPSERGELEITSVNQIYLERGDLHMKKLMRGFAWLDSGTYESLLEAAQFVETIEERQVFKIACLEEIAWINKWLTAKELEKAGQDLKKSVTGSIYLGL